MHRLWDTVQPRSSRARSEDAAEYAAATAQHLFDRVSSRFLIVATATDLSITTLVDISPEIEGTGGSATTTILTPRANEDTGEGVFMAIVSPPYLVRQRLTSKQIWAWARV